MFSPYDTIGFQDQNAAQQQQKNQASQQQKDMADQLLASTNTPIGMPQTPPAVNNSPDFGAIGTKLFQMQHGQQPSAVPVGIPQDSMSWNTGAGPLPWQTQNQLPWLKGGA